MAGLVPTIHALLPAKKDVDARNKCGHDGAVLYALRSSCELSGSALRRPSTYVTAEAASARRRINHLLTRIPQLCLATTGGPVGDENGEQAADQEQCARSIPD